MSPSDTVVLESGLQFEVVNLHSGSILRRAYLSDCSQVDLFVRKNIRIFHDEGKLLFRTAQRIENRSFEVDYFGNKVSAVTLGPPELWICDTVKNDLQLFDILVDIGFLKERAKDVVDRIRDEFAYLKPVSRGLCPSICEADFICLDNLSGVKIGKEEIAEILKFNSKIFGFSMSPVEFSDAVSNHSKHQFVTIGVL